MAKTPRTEKGYFVKGICPNPGGRPKLSDDVRMLLHEKSNEYKRKFLYWCDAAQEKVVKCEGAPWDITAMDRMICSALVQSMNGNYKAFNAVLDRLLGRAIQPLEHSGPNGEAIELKQTGDLSTEEISEMTARMQARLAALMLSK